MELSNAFPGLPNELWKLGHVVCAEFHGWSEPVPGKMWVEFLEQLADELGIPQIHGNVFSGCIDSAGKIIGHKSSGSWKRIRNRSSTILSIPTERHSVNIDSGYDYIVGEGENDGYLAINHVNDSVFKESQFSAVLLNKSYNKIDGLSQVLIPIIADKFKIKRGGRFTTSQESRVVTII